MGYVVDGLTKVNLSTGNIRKL